MGTITGLTAAAMALIVNDRLKPKGAWVGATAYVVSDVVSYNGSLYRRKVAGTTAGTPAADAANWELLVSKGDQGIQGIQGPASSVATDVLFDAKGDLVVGSADNVSVRKAVGSNNDFLVADSAQAGGIKWAGGSTARTALGTPTYSPESFVTSLPGSPVHGQECYYQADAANDVVWHCKYNSVTTKWAVVGGPPLYSEVVAQESVLSAAYVALATAGPSIAVPLAGDYDVKQSYYGYSNSVGASTYMSYDIGGTGATDTDAVSSAVASAAVDQLVAIRQRRKTFAGGITLTSKYKNASGGTTLTVQRRWMSIRPVRVG